MDRATRKPPRRPATQWAHELGAQHAVRDEIAARTAASEADDAAWALAGAAERWPAIVTCIRRVAGAYNTGATRAVLTVTPQPRQPAVTIAAGGDGGPYLTAVLDGSVICVSGFDAHGLDIAAEVPLQADRDDEATAAYLLQHWLRRLVPGTSRHPAKSVRSGTVVRARET